MSHLGDPKDTSIEANKEDADLQVTKMQQKNLDEFETQNNKDNDKPTQDDNDKTPKEQLDENVNLKESNIEKTTVPNVLEPRRKPSHSPNEIIFERRLPRVNCQEKIAIFIDISADMLELPFKYGDGSKHSPLAMVKKIIEIFVATKHRLDPRHEFALGVLLDKAVWFKNFTSEPKEIVAALRSLETTMSYEHFDLTSLFDIITALSPMPSIPLAQQDVLPPPFIMRAILIYGRSSCMPTFLNGHQSFQRFQQCPYNFLDVLYLHEPASAENHCQDIFESLCDLDEHYTSYILEVTRNATKLHNCMAKLLSHPLQRPLQPDCQYSLATPAEATSPTKETTSAPSMSSVAPRVEPLPQSTL